MLSLRPIAMKGCQLPKGLGLGKEANGRIRLPSQGCHGTRNAHQLTVLTSTSKSDLTTGPPVASTHPKPFTTLNRFLVVLEKYL